MNVTIAIPAFNCAATIDKAVSASLSQDYPQGKIEVVVVDDGSTDETAEKIKIFNRVKYIYQKNGGAAKARNTAWRNAQGEIICFTDSDCIPQKDWVARLISHYTSGKIAAVGGSYDIADGRSLLARCIHEEIIQRHLSMRHSTDHLASFNFSCRRKVLEEAGGFDESFKAASAEDNELSYRIRKKGYELLFDKEIKVAHFHKAGLVSYLKQQSRHGYWCMKLYRIHPDMMRGDDYAGWLDYAQMPLSLLIIACLFGALFLIKPFLFFALVLITILILLNTPMAFAIIKRKRDISYLAFVFIASLRSVVRSLGMCSGFLRFFILDSLFNKQKP